MLVLEDYVRNPGVTIPASDVTAFRQEYNAIIADFRKKVDERIQLELASTARSHLTCWDLLQKLRRPRSTVASDVSSLVSHFGKVYFDPNSPLFCIFAPTQKLPLFTGPRFYFEEELDFAFSNEELELALKRLNAKAAVGPQRISSRTIKLVFEDVTCRPILLALMNACLFSETVPSAWGSSEIFVLYKGKGVRSDRDNYRGINLINDFCRLYERLLKARLEKWIEKYDATGRSQFGFKRRSSTLDAVFTLASGWTFRSYLHVLGDPISQVF